MRPLLLLALGAPLLLQAAETRITRMYVFGDSYSDNGAGYVDGNGPTAVVYLARHLGFELKPATAAHSTTDSLNFAVSGGQTGRGAGRKIKDALLGRGLMDQVEDFVARVGAKKVAFPADTTLFYIAGGLNDGRLPTEVTISNLETEIRKLYEVGARRFRMALLPTAIPGFGIVGQRLNPAFRKIPGDLKNELAAARIELSDWGPGFDQVLKNPARYGIENTTDKCAGRALMNEDATPCAKPESYYYYHIGHPSTAVHKAVGAMLFEEMNRSK